jgi:hypothetical protein
VISMWQIKSQSITVLASFTDTNIMNYKAVLRPE